MPVYRTPDGKIVEEKTEIDRPVSSSASITQGNPGAGPQYDAPTVVSTGDSSLGGDGQSLSASPSSSIPESTNKTRLVGAGLENSSDASVEGPKSSSVDPVAGWLVVIDGPGKGCSLNVGVGRNSIGRSATERVSLDFGDEAISREGHLVISYDHRGKQFFVQPGQGQNLTYLNDAPILETRPLESGSELVLGGTTVKFVAFCGDSFNWDDQ